MRLALDVGSVIASWYRMTTPNVSRWDGQWYSFLHLTTTSRSPAWMARTSIHQSMPPNTCTTNSMPVTCIVFNACWRESVKPLLFYCNTLSASLLVEQRKMIFYNKTLHSNSIVLRTLCALHRNEAQKLSSMYHIFPGHSNNFDIKRAVWSCFARLLKI